MTRSQMEAIYKRDYWNKIKGDQITDQNAAAVLFDYAVNAGVGAAVKAAQTVLGVAVDGGLGPQTLAAINRAGAGFAGRLTKYRVSFYTRLATSNPAKYGKYLAGWLKRAESFFKLTPASAAGGGLVLAVGAAGAFYMLKKKGMI